MAQPFNEFEDVFIIDSIPIPIVQLVRKKNRFNICKSDFESAPYKGYSLVSKSYYYINKIHQATTGYTNLVLS